MLKKSGSAFFETAVFTATISLSLGFLFYGFKIFSRLQGKLNVKLKNLGAYVRCAHRKKFVEPGRRLG
jgi:hypothetical protein